MVNLIFMSLERYVAMEHKSSMLGQKLRTIVILLTTTSLTTTSSTYTSSSIRGLNRLRRDSMVRQECLTYIKIQFPIRINNLLTSILSPPQAAGYYGRTPTSLEPSAPSDGPEILYNERKSKPPQGAGNLTQRRLK